MEKMKRVLIIAALATASITVTAQTSVKKTINKADMDLTAKPGENFYEYADGSWLKSHPLDAVHPMNGAFTDLSEQNNDRIRELVNEYSGKKLPQGTVGQKIGSLYRMYMDSVGRNRMGYTPMKAALVKIRAIKNRKECLQTMLELGAKGYASRMFSFGLGIDEENSDKYIFGASQGGIYLEPEYYTHPNESQKAVVAAYKSFCKDLLKMIGNDDVTAQKKMEAVFAIENQIAKVSYDQVKGRDPRANIHKMAWAKLLKDFPGIDWVGICKAYGYPTDIDTVDVGQPEPIHEVEKILATAPLYSLKAYMELRAIQSSVTLLDDKFNNRNFEYNKAIYGVQQQQPRWKRGVGFIQGLLGESIGKLYVAKYFPESSKQKAYQLIKNLQDAFAQRIEENTWMTAATKTKAIEKLRSMKINVGYPDKWEDMEKYVNIDESKSLRANYDAIVPALRKAELEKHWKKPVDKTQMACNPQMVNAFYSPEFNSLNFPAAILQSPFFDANAEDAVNYGGIGAVIGHEMSHGFDDEGCQFDKDGNLRNWWTAEDKANYDKRTKVLADWFSKQEVQPGLKVDGKKTLGENIGDNGGINIAFRAFQNVMKQNPEDTKEIEGFTPEQRFFLSYGRIWASNVAPQFVAYLVNSDTHSPNNLRVNAALPMIDAWYNAFNIKATDKMFVPVENRAHIW
jgi:putative endopeptidase